jgi:hypothetical protein
LQTEPPYWLAEAYSDAIDAADTGIVERNYQISRRLASILYLNFDSRGRYLDIAGGYGLLTRAMRDLGFDFYWSDKYCANLFARGFARFPNEAKFSALTAFEVLEHLEEPMRFIDENMRLTGARTFIFSTELFSGDAPAQNWWYYAFHSGQHIGFFQQRTLEFIAQALGLRLLTADGLHCLTDRPISPVKYRLAGGAISHLLRPLIRKRLGSKTVSDSAQLRAW